MKTKLQPYQEIIDALAGLGQIQPSQEFRKRLQVELLPVSQQRSGRAVNWWLMQPAVWGLILVLSLGAGTVWAATNSQPGDLLFPVKQAVQEFISPESAQTESKEADGVSENEPETTPTPHDIQEARNETNLPESLPDSSPIPLTPDVLEIITTPPLATDLPLPLPTPGVEETVNQVLGVTQEVEQATQKSVEDTTQFTKDTLEGGETNNVKSRIGL